MNQYPPLMALHCGARLPVMLGIQRLRQQFRGTHVSGEIPPRNIAVPTSPLIILRSIVLPTLADRSRLGGGPFPKQCR